MTTRLGLYSMEVGEVAWMAISNGNRDGGEERKYFVDEMAARAYSRGFPDPPNRPPTFPRNMNIRVFRVERR